MTDHASRPQFVRAALEAKIAEMLDDLGNPPLVDRIYPKGWRLANDASLSSLYDLCIRTFQSRQRYDQA